MEFEIQLDNWITRLSPSGRRPPFWLQHLGMLPLKPRVCAEAENDNNKKKEDERSATTSSWYLEDTGSRFPSSLGSNGLLPGFFLSLVLVYLLQRNGHWIAYWCVAGTPPSSTGPDGGIFRWKSESNGRRAWRAEGGDRFSVAGAAMLAGRGERDTQKGGGGQEQYRRRDAGEQAGRWRLVNKTSHGQQSTKFSAPLQPHPLPDFLL